jgi:radical SAM superfamily enzyme with C-terminal helix-hairpin-helix motif
VGTAASVGLLAAGAAWRLTGAAAAGHALVTTATTGNGTEQVLAKMLLVKAGNRSVPLVTRTLFADPAATDLVEVLASIGTREARKALVELTHTPSTAGTPHNRDAAAQALRTLDEIGHRDSDPG